MVKNFLNKLVNLFLYGKFVFCKHNWYPVGYVDFKCTKCGVLR